ncbi:MAG: DUF2141 domain-containing protein [Pseudomonadota bacterium]
MIFHTKAVLALATGLAISASAEAQIADQNTAGEGSIAEPAKELQVAQSVRVRFTGVSPEEGKLWISLCTREEAARLAQGGCSQNAQIPAVENAEHMFKSAAPGTYMISAFHDDNDNGRLDFDQQGIPFEAIGNSRNAVGEFGPPTFDQVKFELRPLSETAQTLSLTIEMRRIELP